MDLDQLLQETSHVPDHPALSPWTPPVVAARRRRRPTLLKVAAAAAVVAALVAAPVFSTGGARPSASADAAEVLHTAAVAAGNQPDGNWKDANYWHTTSTYGRDGRTITRQVWIGHHTQGVLIDPGVAPGAIGLDWPDFKGVPWDDLWTLPTDTTGLRARVREMAAITGNNIDQEMFIDIGDLLRETPAPPKLRAALYNVAATIPGVKLLGPMTDHAGRPGVGVGRKDVVLIFDVHDGRLLEDREQADGPHPWVLTLRTQGPSATAPAVTQRG
jgi:hypothetical protein